ncbi:MAG: alanyl-tRNA editing protein [Anaerolineales bacterium]|nr:alanyl-tRNA editing protein [Anaerolineales bacterium]
MSLRLYHDDSYLKEFTAQVISIDDGTHGVSLDQTAFFPGGGGQPCDRGLLIYLDNDVPVEKIKTINGELFHCYSQSLFLPDIGTKITGRIDWDYRYQLMRTHTAMHILCGVIFRDYGASVTGGNMTPLKGRMDFEFASLHKELVAIIEKAVNLEIDYSRPVSWRSIPREEAIKIPDLIRTKINLLPPRISEVRVVEIEGLDLQADGGTHVKNTSEVGKVKISDYKSKGRENKRIYLELIE